MKTIFILLTTFSLNLFANCDMLVHDGGWTADGRPGVVEITFSSDGSMSINFDGEVQGNPITTYRQGEWNCSNLVVTLKAGNSITTGVLTRGEDLMWSIRLGESEETALSNRELTPYGL